MSFQEETANLPQEPEVAQKEREHVSNNPDEFIAAYRDLERQLAEIRNAVPPAINQTSSNPLLATPSSTPSPSVPSSQLAAIIEQLMKRPAFPPRSEKLPDIPEYDGDEDKLDAWEQNLIQKMHINHDRYFSDEAKIAYAESRLTIGKRAHLLMTPYRIDGLCRLTSFSDWRAKLRLACGNPFEQEDARKYLRDTLKQGNLTFEEYYNLFSQKKERSKMEDASLIDAMKANINYSTQTAAIHYRVPGTNQEPVTFDEHVAMWAQTDRKIRQIRHISPRQASGASISNSSTKKGASVATTTAVVRSPAPRSSTIVVAPAVTPAAVPSLPAGDPMDLSSAMAAVKGQSLKVPGVKEICEQWRLCFYCKQSHPGKTAIDCPNKKAPSTIRSLVLYNDSDASEDAAGKA